MRVLVDGLPLLGEAGMTNYLRELLLSLVAEDDGHEYRLFFRAFRKQTRARIAQLAGEPGLSQFPTTVTRVPDSLLEWCWTLRSLHLPLTELWLGRPEIFLSTIYLTPVFRDVSVVMIAYDLIPLRFPHFYGQDQSLFTARFRRGIERAGAIIAISECTKRDLVELLGADPAKIHIVYPGVDSRFGSAADAGARERVLARYGLRQPYLLYVGSLVPRKNVGTLVRVFRRLKQVRRIPHQLVLCGRVGWGREVVDAAQDLIAAGDCVVLDFLPAPDLPDLYQAAEAFALLSLYEGFGLPPLEAMASGVPVVVSNAGALPEVVGEAGLQVLPTDEAAAEEALYRVLTDDDLRRELRERGFRQAARFRWPEAARQTLKVFAAARGAR